MNRRSFMRMALGGAVAAVLPLPVVRAKRINAVDALIDMGIPDSPRLQEMRAWLDELEVAEDYTGNHCIRCIFSFPNCPCNVRRLCFGPMIKMDYDIETICHNRHTKGKSNH